MKLSINTILFVFFVFAAVVSWISVYTAGAAMDVSVQILFAVAMSVSAFQEWLEIKRKERGK